MTTQRLALTTAAASSALDAVIEELGDIPVVTEPTVVRRRSRDFFWYSPILNEQLSGKAADIIVAPRDEADVIRVAAACARHRVPITPAAAARAITARRFRWRAACCST